MSKETGLKLSDFGEIVRYDSEQSATSTANQNLALRPMIEIENIEIETNGMSGLDYNNCWHIVR